jgi:hypothetical protein
MELKINVSEEDIIEAIARVYAEKLYANQMDRIFGLNDDVKTNIKESARKQMIQMPEVKQYIKELLEDRNFLKKCIGETVKEKAEEILDEMSP